MSSSFLSGGGSHSPRRSTGRCSPGSDGPAYAHPAGTVHRDHQSPHRGRSCFETDKDHLPESRWADGHRGPLREADEPEQVGGKEWMRDDGGEGGWGGLQGGMAALKCAEGLMQPRGSSWHHPKETELAQGPCWAQGRQSWAPREAELCQHEDPAGHPVVPRTGKATLLSGVP